jgi:hypothetical protein
VPNIIKLLASSFLIHEGPISSARIPNSLQRGSPTKRIGVKPDLRLCGRVLHTHLIHDIATNSYLTFLVGLRVGGRVVGLEVTGSGVGGVVGVRVGTGVVGTFVGLGVTGSGVGGVVGMLVGIGVVGTFVGLDVPKFKGKVPLPACFPKVFPDPYAKTNAFTAPSTISRSDEPGGPFNSMTYSMMVVVLV